MADRIQKYMELVQARPELFLQSELIPLVLDESEMRSFEASSGKPMGVVYDNSPYYMVLADLCRGKKGCFSYARVVSCNPKSAGTVAIPYCQGHFGLISIFRHGPRKKMLEFPRGFAELPGLTLEENMRKELSEELGITPDNCTIVSIGHIVADSGLVSASARVFLAEFDSLPETVLSGEEGITKFQWFTEAQFRKMIAKDMITDGFTLSAFAKYLTIR